MFCVFWHLISCEIRVIVGLCRREWAGLLPPFGWARGCLRQPRRLKYAELEVLYMGKSNLEIALELALAMIEQHQYQLRGDTNADAGEAAGDIFNAVLSRISATDNSEIKAPEFNPPEITDDL